MQKFPEQSSVASGPGAASGAFEYGGAVAHAAAPEIGTSPRDGASPAEMRKVVLASVAGTTFEWYDFFLFVPLAAVLSRSFFGGMNETAGYIFALSVFAVGFAFRPLGALLFGHIGDKRGRKATFLVTMALMGLATFGIGLLPGYATIGVAAPVLFIILRILQGLALGGEWGGAATYIVEHVGSKRRGYTSSWLGASAAFGLGGALLAVLAARMLVGEAAFVDWGWRLPFLFSLVLLAISMWIRSRLHESPAFLRLKAEGGRSDRPLAESFLQWTNLKLVLTALFGIMVAQGAVWYTVFFYLPSFLEKAVRVPPAMVNALMLLLVAISVPFYVFFGWLSDRVGRKPVMVGGMLLFATALFPAFHLLTEAANPKLEAASRAAPVVVVADPSGCNFQFDPIGQAEFQSGCDIAKATLAEAGIPYSNEAASRGAIVVVRIGEATVSAPALDGSDSAASRMRFADALRGALLQAGYPRAADPAAVDRASIMFVAIVLMIGATALYGPQAAALVELFPTRIRYTAMSLPYHVGTGWVGGFLPPSVFAIVAATGNVYGGLWYPFGFTVLAIVIAVLFLPETRDHPV